MRLITIAGLVAAQTAPSIFVGLGLPTIFRQQGVELATLSILALAAVPYWFKWLWAPLVDRLGSHRFGRRKSWIVPCTLLGAAAYAALGLLPPTLELIWPLVGCLALIKLLMATQDIAVDAYTIESLDPGEESSGATAAAVGSVLGGLMGSSVFLALFEHLGWPTVMALAGLFLVLGSLPATLRRERPPRVPEVSGALQPGLVQSLTAHLRSPATLAVLVVVFGSAVCMNLPFVVEGAFLVDKGMSLTEIGFLTGGGVVLGNLVGLTLSGRFAESFGLSKTFALGAVVSVLSGIGYVLVSAYPASNLQVAVVSLVATVVTCPAYIALNASRFAWVDPRRVATDYTVQSSVNGLAQSTARAAGPLLAGSLGWPVFFAVSGVLLCLSAWVLYRLHSRLTRLVEQRNRRADAAQPPTLAGVGTKSSST